MEYKSGIEYIYIYIYIYHTPIRNDVFYNLGMISFIFFKLKNKSITLSIVRGGKLTFKNSGTKNELYANFRNEKNILIHI